MEHDRPKGNHQNLLSNSEDQCHDFDKREYKTIHSFLLNARVLTSKHMEAQKSTRSSSDYRSRQRNSYTHFTISEVETCYWTVR